MQFLELKSAIAKAKISPELFNSIFEQAEERMRNLQSRLIEITQSELKKEKKMKKDSKTQSPP